MPLVVRWTGPMEEAGFKEGDSVIWTLLVMQSVSRS